MVSLIISHLLRSVSSTYMGICRVSCPILWGISTHGDFYPWGFLSKWDFCLWGFLFMEISIHENFYPWVISTQGNFYHIGKFNPLGFLPMGNSTHEEFLPMENFYLWGFLPKENLTHGEFNSWGVLLSLLCNLDIVNFSRSWSWDLSNRPTTNIFL